MRIIKAGNPPKEKKYIAHCNDCECEFEFTKKDSVFTRDWWYGDCYVINCPCCQEEMIFDASKLK